MVKDVLKRFSTLALAALMVLTMLPVMAMAADLSGLTDTTIGLSADSSGTWEAIGTRITGSINGDGCNSSATTLTITNKRQIKVNLLFDYEVNLNSGTVTIDGTAISTNGSFQKELGPDETVEIKLASNSSDTLATTIGINNIRMIEDKSVTVTFTPAENGVYTVNGSSVAENFSLTQSSLTAFALSATPNDGYIFVGWYDKTNDKYLRGGSNADVLIPYDCEVTAKFAETGSVFGVGTEKFDDLETAVNYAVGNGISQVTLLKDHTITGNYTIPQGITLLIPFDDAGTCYKETPEPVGDTSTSPSAFRTLSMSAGSSITVEGAISVSAKHSAEGNKSTTAWGGGAPSGPYGYIKMDASSKITVASGGTLYAWGYISGDGSIIAESGSTVYENMQIRDFRGGTATNGLKTSAKNKAFFFNQYYIQNIEVELTLEYGANEFVYTSLYAGGDSNSTTIQFIGNGGMFNVAPGGTLSKMYLRDRDRLEVTVNGDATISNLSLTLSLGFMSLSLDSKDYVLPITNGMTITILSGTTTLTQDIAMLPGVEINISEGATLQVDENCNLYVYDRDEWVGKQFARADIMPVSYSPNRVYTRNNADIVDCMIDVNGTLQVNGYIYTTAGGANICSSKGTGKVILNSGAGTATETYQVVNASSSVTAVPATPAKLRNADGTYFKTATVEAGTTVNYYKEYGAWHHHEIVAEIRNARAESCTEDGYSGDTYCKTCDMMIKYGYSIDAHHTLKYHDKAEPTCTATGMEEYWECTVCKNLYADEGCTKLVEKLDDLKIDAKGHTPGKAVKEDVVPATCEIAGSYDEVVYCQVCGNEVSRVSKTLSALGHTPGEAKRENVVEPSCMVDGRYEEVVYCSVCNDEISRVTKKIEATGHTPVDVAEVPATCTKPGTAAGTKCGVCGDELSGFEVIPPAGHQWDEGKVTTEPTCEGTGVKTFTCSNCQEKRYEDIPATGHQWDEGKVTTEPKCEEAGVKTYTCKVCKETKTEKIDKTNDHTPGEAQRENVKEATCTKDGSYDEVVRCKVCNKELSREPKTITSPGHQWDDGVVTTEPKCEEAGVKTYTCKVCKETKTEAIDATGHTPVEVPEVPATCTEPGKKAGTKCSVCNKILSGVEEIPAKGHTPGKAVKESVVLATCEAAGSYEEVVYCEVCKEELTRVSKTLPAMGHTRGEAVRENVIDSTCADEGSCDEVVYCEVCKKELSREAKVIEKKAHTPVDVAEVPATCTEPGTTAGTKCDVCGTILSGVKEIPANGHTEVIRNAKPATDTEDGYTGDVYCEVCNELLRNGEVIPATHVKITWIINGVKHETVCAKGEIPVYDGETPAKPETSRFTYEFKGWDKEIVAATENAEYTAEFTAIGKNGLCIEGNDTFWIKNGVNIAFPGLIRIADENGHIHYYYFAEDGKAVKNGNYKVNKNNGLPLPEYGFAFDSDGVIVHDEDTSKNGICDGDGSKFYYIDGVKVGEGLIKVGDYYYYARTSSGEIVRNRQYWITKTNELPIQQGIFDFDAEGRMIVTGFIHAFGATYYYDNGVLAKGFTKIGDDYYIFNASSGKMYSNAMMWVPDNEYGITGGMYEFDADGKMIRTGFITTGGYTYYYDNGVLAKGFTKIGDDYYFFNAGSGKMYRDATLWVADNAEYGFVGGMYYFGADGKMVLPDIENGKKSIVTINGKKYLTIDGAYAPTGLYEIDGNCYYVKAAGELAVGETVWVDNKNGLIPAKGDWRAFDAEGKLIHTGFVTGGDGYVYHYTDDVLSLGFTCIDGEYYLFNAGSGKMYRDANMWVGPNDYGIVGGMYYFDANGKMAR